MKLTMVDDCRYRCRLGTFYKIFALNDDSWEFKPESSLTERDIREVMDAMHLLKRGRFESGETGSV